jgi:hypothetical protein
VTGITARKKKGRPSAAQRNGPFVDGVRWRMEVELHAPRCLPSSPEVDQRAGACF